MCGRFAIFHSPDILASAFDVPPSPSIELRGYISPIQQALIVREDLGGRKLTQAWWGLVSNWSKIPVIGSHMINARTETVTNKPGFRDMIKYYRCVVPASGYYEWNHKGAESKQYYISMSDGSLLGFVGFWDSRNHLKTKFLSHSQY